MLLQILNASVSDTAFWDSEFAILQTWVLFKHLLQFYCLYVF